MRMNEIIKEKRKALDMTQEQMAAYLGVTAPAVHKWEKGTSLPDTALLPALARLLHVDLNTLFAFEKELTEQEINVFVNEMIQEIQKSGYEAGFETAMEKVREFPNCEKLLLSIASALDGALTIFCVEEREKYTKDIENLYERAAQSMEEKVRNSANQMLIIKALQRKEFDKAERLWEALPEIQIDKKMVKAAIYMNQQKDLEAIRLLEENLYIAAAKAQNCLVDLMLCFEKTGQQEELEFCGETLKKVVDALGLWSYGKYMADYQVAIAKKDREKTLEALRLMLASMNENYRLHDFLLYREIQQSKSVSHLNLLSHSLIESLQKSNGVDGEGFLKGDEELAQILAQ